MRGRSAARKVTRRQFVKGTAAVGALAALSDKLLGGAAPALVERASAARQAGGEDTFVPHFCYLCNAGPDPLRVRVRDGVAIKVEGNPNLRREHPADGAICSKPYGYIQQIYNPYRVKGPMKRTNPGKGDGVDAGWQEISWDEALDIVAGKLAEVRDKGPINEQGLPRIATTTGADGVPGYYNGTWSAFWNAWGPTDGTLGCGGGTKCYHSEHIYGERWHRGFTCIGDLPLSRYQIIFGQNSNATGGVVGFRRYADARERGMKIVVLDPNQTVTGATADEWIPILPKTDAAVLFAMMNVVLHEIGKVDEPFLKERTNSPYLVGADGYFVREAESGKPLIWDPVAGKARPYDAEGIRDYALQGTYAVQGAEARPAFQLLKEHMANFTPEWASPISEVPAETIRRLAQEFVENANIRGTIEIDGKVLPHRPVSIKLGKSINNGFGGYQSVWAAHVLSLLVGGLEVPGGHLGTCTLFGGPVRPGYDGFPTSSVMGDHPTDAENWQWPPNTRDGIRTLCPISAYMGPSHLSWKHMVDPPENWPQAAPPDIWFTYKTNPVVAQSDKALVIEGIKAIPFFVAFAYTVDETSQFADLILPESTGLESYQLCAMGGRKFMENFWDHIGYHLRQPVVSPPFNTRDISDIFTELADRLGMLEAYNTAINMGWLRDPKTREPGPFVLDPTGKYSVEEIVDHHCLTVTNGEHGLEWFKENGAFLVPWSRLNWYLHDDMVEMGLRYELPYQEHIKKIGEELAERLHEKGITWWDHQAEEFQALPEWHDFPAVYDTGSDYDLWLICHRTSQFAWANNADIPWMVELGKQVLDIGKASINPQAARQRGIRDGDEIWIESPVGKIKAVAQLREGVHPKVVSTAEHFGHYIMPVAKETGWPNMNFIMPITHARTDETGSESDHVKVKVYRA